MCFDYNEYNYHYRTCFRTMILNLETSHYSVNRSNFAPFKNPDLALMSKHNIGGEQMLNY